MECAQDILEELGHFAGDPVAPASASSEHALFAYLGYDPIGMDQLSLRSGLTIEALSAILLQLELEGSVATLPGGLYQRVG